MLIVKFARLYKVIKDLKAFCASWPNWHSSNVELTVKIANSLELSRVGSRSARDSRISSSFRAIKSANGARFGAVTGKEIQLIRRWCTNRADRPVEQKRRESKRGGEKKSKRRRKKGLNKLWRSLKKVPNNKNETR